MNQKREILFEFRRVGDYVKVSAVDPVTNIEVSIVGSPRTSQAVLQQIAARKLVQAIERAIGVKPKTKS